MKSHEHAMKTPESFVECIIEAAPELKRVIQEHLSWNKTLLPHVFMGDVTRLVLELAMHPDRQGSLIRLLGRMDEGLRLGSEKVQELIVASFVENLIGEDAKLRLLAPLMGPTLRQRAKTVCGSQWLEPA
jgi:hypothetical protein